MSDYANDNELLCEDECEEFVFLTDEEMLEKVKQYRKAKIDAELASDRSKALATEIRQGMGLEERRVVGEYQVTSNYIKTRKFDMEQFKENHPDLYEKYSRPYYQRRFRVL